MILVEVTGQFMLLDPENRQEINYRRPHVVTNTAFISHRAVLGQVKVIANDLKDGATDAEFAGYWKEADGNREMAIEAFLSKFGPNAAPVEAPPAPKAKEKGKGKA